jgi:DsbC/DsbD-like thiol-disulfide interchange protein
MLALLRGKRVLHRIREKEPRNRKHLVAVAATAMVVALLLPALFETLSAGTNRDGAGARSRANDNRAQAMVVAGEIKTRVTLSGTYARSGQRVGVVVDFDIAPGWHVYGNPLPADYTPTTVTFDHDLLSEQNLEFPKPTPVKFELLGETLPVYQGHFMAVGNIFLRQKIVPGEHRLGGTLVFQECNDNLCKMPQQVRFEIPLRIDSPPAS